MYIAAVGCGHGKLTDMYKEIRKQESLNPGVKVQLLIICGDFQATRNRYDLSRMACPDKYKNMEDFHQYYSGELEAPVPTLFIGGNHEAPNHLWELWHGGWVAPSIYYLGTSGVVWFGGLRIAGISGIYKSHDYLKPFSSDENPPSFDNNNGSAPRSPYHYRSLEIEKLASVNTLVDIMISHDWPNKIFSFGNVPELLKRKPHFKKDINEENGLGSPPLMDLLEKVKPRFWFSGHLHIKYPAVYAHQGPIQSSLKSQNSHIFRSSIISNIDESEEQFCTRFLALDKCLSRRQYMQIININEQVPERPPVFSYDPEWIEILRNTNEKLKQLMPWSDCFSQAFSADINNDNIDDYVIPESFERLSPTLDEEKKGRPNSKLLLALYLDKFYPNPQTLSFCKKIGIPCVVYPPMSYFDKNLKSF